MNRRLLMPLNSLVNRKPRMFFPDSGTLEKGYIQHLYRSELSVAFIFTSNQQPAWGSYLTDRLTGNCYKIREQLPLRDGSRFVGFELSIAPVQ